MIDMHYLKSLNVQVFLGILLGISFGVLAPTWALEQKLIGDMFVALLKMLVVPLVFASIYTALTGLGSVEKLKNIGLKTIGLYLLTTALSVFLAILVMNIFPIGEPISAEGLEYAKAAEIKPFSFHDMIMSFIPSNVFNSLASGYMMQVIVFAVFLALASFKMEQKYQDVLFDLFTAINEAMFHIAKWVINLTPIGVFSLISYIIAKQGIDVILGLWEYVLIVLAVIIIHAVVTLPLVLAFFAKINPYEYLNKVKEASIMAFSTASSAATLPVSLRVVQGKGGVSKESAGFVLPLGATVSMDGTAAYLTIAVLYIANLAGVDMTLGDQLVLGVTVVALSVGVAALPSASLVMMVVILNQVGLPVEYLAIIVAVDRILDMARTALNVTSDLVVTKIVDEIEKRKKV
ncbi:MAG TPA: dicarboxylate/amino acid:cation symporter [Campylobacterales bacterium]|nr:dicarboxylate/amino acid:cation symporter [Campylobacterales bacterium]